MTPLSINDNVNKLLDYLDAEFDPIYLNIIPEPDANTLDCFRIVSQKVKFNGGKVIYGWAVWEHKYFIEAECHAVWEDSRENLVDITPRNNKNIKRILFIEDSRIRYEEKQISNIRYNFSKNLLVDDLFAVCDAFFRLRNKGNRSLVDDLSTILTNEELIEIKNIGLLKEMILHILNSDGTRESICLCKSGRRFKNCCGKNIINKMLSV